MTKKIIPILACLFFTITPFQASAMQQAPEIQKLLALLIPPNYTHIRSKQDHTQRLDDMMTRPSIIDDLNKRSEIIYETKCNIFKLFMSIHKSVETEFLQTENVSDATWRLAIKCKPLVELHKKISREQSVRDLYDTMLHVFETCLKIRKYLDDFLEKDTF